MNTQTYKTFDNGQSLRTVKKWYHATTLELADKILSDGYIMPMPQSHNLNLIYLAALREDAGYFPRARGHSKYAMFEIQRRDLDGNKLFTNPATRDMISAVYCKPIPVSLRNYKPVIDQRDLTFGLPGLELRTEGNRRTQLVLNDPAAFEKHLENRIGIENYEKFKSIVKQDPHKAEQFLKKLMLATA
jgi:hypothetical protein